MYSDYPEYRNEVKEFIGDLKTNNPRYLDRSKFFSGRGLMCQGAELLAEALSSNTTLKGLDLTFNDIGKYGAQALAKMLNHNRTLVHLNLESNRIDPKGAKMIGEALANNSSLISLNISFNGIGIEGAEGFAEGLSKNSTLEVLFLRCNKITTEGAEMIADALFKNNTLVNIDISDNQIGTEGIMKFAEMMAQNTTLTSLKIKGFNEAFTDNDALNLRNIDKKLELNIQLLEHLQVVTSQVLKAARVFARKTLIIGQNTSPLAQLPLEIREYIVMFIDKYQLLTNEQMRHILNYAQGDMLPVADKNRFFKVTKCNRVMKNIDISIIENISSNNKISKKKNKCVLA